MIYCLHCKRRLVQKGEGFMTESLASAPLYDVYGSSKAWTEAKERLKDGYDIIPSESKGEGHVGAVVLTEKQVGHLESMGLQVVKVS